VQPKAVPMPPSSRVREPAASRAARMRPNSAIASSGVRRREGGAPRIARRSFHSPAAKKSTLTPLSPHRRQEFDATLAGIGGCPHAPGASGNAASEDLAFMLASMGIETGIDLERLLALRAKVAGWLAGETLHGTLWRAGLPKTFRARSGARRAEHAA
jgi:hypothetical protein